MSRIFRPACLSSVSRAPLFALLVLPLVALSLAARAGDTAPAGQDLPAYINQGHYDFVLGGDATWNSNLEINSLARSTLTIDGQGNTVLVRAGGNSMISSFSYNNSTVALRNITFRPDASYPSANQYLLGFPTANVTINLDLYGTTFQGFNRTQDKGGTVLYVSATNSTINVSGGDSWDTALTFLNNRAEWDANGAIAVANGTLNLTGHVVIDGNRSGNYGGAVAIYETGTALTFGGPTRFSNNVSGVFGGGLDVWGGGAKVTFDDVAIFDNNSVYFNPANPNTYEEPRHVTDQHARGGAINVGYIASSGTGTVLTFNSEATFTGNHVVSLGAATNNRDAYGGAISVFGNNTIQNYQLIFNDAAIFRDNYVYALNGAGNGGAIFYDTGGATLSLVGGTIFENNFASTYGGAIYLQAGTINLTADTADITFEGNRHGVTFSGNAPETGTGTPNAIYLGSGGNLNLTADDGRTIHFHDPVASITGSNVVVSKSGAGDVLFYGDGGETTDYDSVLQATTNVTGGRFILQNGVNYGSTSYGTFTVGNGGTLLGGGGASVRAQALIVQNGGSLGADGGTFTADAATINLQSGAVLVGDGTLAATSNLNTTGTLFAAIDEDDTLEVTATLAGTGSLNKTGDGVLVLSAANTYTGATTVNEGALRGGTANAFAASSAVTVNANGTLELGGYNQSANNLSGSGSILLDRAVLTAQMGSAGTFSGAITGDGGLAKTGTATLTLTGDNSYSGGTTVSGGRLVATAGTALGSGLATVASGATLELAYDTTQTFSNRLTGTGTLEKTGSGTAILTGANSTVGTATVLAGALALEESGIFTAGSYRTDGGAATVIGGDAALNVATEFVQEAGSTLTVTIGSNSQPAVTAATARIAGTLNITGFESGDLAKASMVDDEQYVVIQTSGGITGDFNPVNIEAHGVTQDYLTVTGSFSSDRNRYLVGLGLAWYAAADVATGNFTLVDETDTFEVDVVLADRTDPVTSGWSGTDLVKMGDGTLILSEENTYTGVTDVRDGTLRTGADNAFADSSRVNVAAGALLDLDGYDQTANNLNGAGNIDLGDATLTANYSSAETISGDISGTGELVKTGTATLTLSGDNSHSGGTTASAGRVIATTGTALGTGTASAGSGAVIELALAGNTDVGNAFSGAGTLEKTGAGTARLTATGGSIATVDVRAGGLFLDQNGTFNAGNYTTRNGAVTSIGEDATMVLTGAYTQETGGTLNVTIGDGNEPAITAASANLNGTLNVTGFSADLFARASAFDGNRYVVVQTDTAMTKGFDDVDIGTTIDPVDYLTIGGFLASNNSQYVIEFGLTWYTSLDAANGTFTLTDATDTFNVDVVLANRDGVTSGWDGRSLTKAGDGTLILSAVNTYTGSTIVEAGTLRAGVANAFAASTAVQVDAGATLDLAGYNQVAQNLTGAGAVTLGTATLEARNTTASEFQGVISGTGRVNKTGSGDLTLSGTNSYTGGTTVTAGRLIATNTGAVGTGAASVGTGATLELNVDTNDEFSNALTGTGTFEKTGSGTASLTNLSSNIGAVVVTGGGLSFEQAGNFQAGSYTTAGGAVTSIENESQLVIANTFTQEAGSTLNVAVGDNNDPAIRAANAVIDGALDITGFGAGAFSAASEIPSQRYTVIATTGGITGSFGPITIDAVAPADYLTVGSIFNDARTEFYVQFGLSWYAATDVATGNFTLDAGEAFNVDVALNDRTQTITSGWDGRSLTKLGDGTLILSAVNGYTGATNVSGGTLRLGIANAIGASEAVTVASGAELDLDGFDQTLNNLNGAGDVLLGSAALTADYDAAHILSGELSGSGSFTKTGNADLTLSGDNAHSGGTTVAGGNLIATSYTALGTGTARVEGGAALNLALDSNGDLANVLAGSGNLIKSGTGIATLGATGSSIGSVDVTGGGLALVQDGAFSAGDFTVRAGTSLSIGDESQLVLTGDYVQETGADLFLAVGDANEPAIRADTADLNGSLTVTGFDTDLFTRASNLLGNDYVVVRTDTAMVKGFDTVDVGTAADDIDYLTVGGFLQSGDLEYAIRFGLTWYTDGTVAHGTFTLDDGELFDVDIALNDRTDPITSGWDGKSLTKNGEGTLILSAQNLYTGATTVNAGTLATADAPAFANSSRVTVNAGATLALNGPAQTVRDLNGAGDVVLGNGTAATVDSVTDTILSGTVSGAGSLNKTGNGTFTLSGDNSYSGGTTVSQGTLTATGGSSLGTGGVEVTSGANLGLNFSGDETVVNRLSGPGSLIKDGAGTAHLTAGGSSIGDVTVAAGELSLEGDGTFTAASYTTEAGATTMIGSETQLVVTGAFEQEGNSILNVAIGPDNQPNITADTADLDGVLMVSGFSLDTISRASLLPGALYTVIRTESGISGDFDDVVIDNALDPTDYLTVTGRVNGNDYDIGLQLTWFAGPDKGNGIFTIDGSGSFEVDQILDNQTGPFTSGWDGETLTKAGIGTLVLSRQNTYTGGTIIQEGTLQTDVANAFANSSEVVIEDGATLDMNGYSQTANNLQGEGTIETGGGNAVLTAVNDRDTELAGSITGDGSLVKDGGSSLTLSGENSYTGGTTVADGTLIATGGNALGSGDVDIGVSGALELNFSDDMAFANSLSGGGELVKTGTGTATLTANGSSAGSVRVEEGTLELDMAGTFTAGDYTTENGATTVIDMASSLDVTGTFTQDSGSSLTVCVGGTEPIVTADEVYLAGTLNVNCFDADGVGTASSLLADEFVVIRSGSAINNDFDLVVIDATSSVDYLTITGRISDDDLEYLVGFQLTWYLDNDANGDFTITGDNQFVLDVALENRNKTFPGWDGNSLTKKGTGTLVLAAVNTYSGSTRIEEGTVRTTVDNAFASSTEVVIDADGTLDLAGTSQTAQHLQGQGTIALGDNGRLTAQNSTDTEFAGTINGDGSVRKTGGGTLTLSGENTYTGGTAIEEGTLAATNGSSMGTGDVRVDSGASLELAIAGGTEDFANTITGNGDLTKTGGGIARLTGQGSSVGDVDVTDGTLFLDMDGSFSAGSHTTAGGATTDIGYNSNLDVAGAFTQDSGSTLSVQVGWDNEPMVTAGSADIAGTLAISNFDPTVPASVLVANRHTIIESDTPITGDFDTVDFGGLLTGVDFLILDGQVDAGGLTYSAGFALAWYAGPAEGTGSFTLLDPDFTFEVDVALSDQNGMYASGWNGRDLTKYGEGTLILSATNSYTGATTVNGGTLLLTADDALGQSSSLTIANGATVGVDGADQTVGRLTAGTGSTLAMDGGSLTIDSSRREAGDTAANTVGDDVLVGDGSLTLLASDLEVTGSNDRYTGDVTASGGSNISLDSADGLGQGGSLTLTGSTDSLEFAASSGGAAGSFGKDLAGDGTVHVRDGQDVDFTGDNSGYAGLFDVNAGGTMRAGAAENLGSADILADGSLVLSSIGKWRVDNSVTGSGQFIKDGIGQLVVGDGFAGFAGTTRVARGALIVGDGIPGGTAVLGGSNVQVDEDAILSGTGSVAGTVFNEGNITALNALDGYGNAGISNFSVGALTNAGTIRLAGGSVGNTLTVRGGMTSNDGLLVINTVLGGDDSPTDRLILDGGATVGTTGMIVNNRGGRGGATNIGILVVDARNGATTTGDAFVLSALSPGFRSGFNTIAAGAYDYTLVKGGNGGEEESWYLLSAETSRPEVGAHLVNREAAESLFHHSLYDRLEGYEKCLDPENGGLKFGRAWGRMEVARGRYSSDRLGLKTVTKTFLLQTGLDVWQGNILGAGSFRAGVMGGLGDAWNRSEPRNGDAMHAKGRVDGYQLGLYGTWFADRQERDGLYLDAWAQHAWFRNKTSSTGLASERYNSRLWTFSLESGYSFPIYSSASSAWSVVPTLQIAYNDFVMGRYSEANGTVLDHRDNGRFFTRAGIRVKGRIADGGLLASEPYAEVNWRHTSKNARLFMNEQAVRMDGTRNTYEIKLGIEKELRKDLRMGLGVSGQVGDRKYRRIAGQLGISYRW